MAFMARDGVSRSLTKRLWKSDDGPGRDPFLEKLLLKRASKHAQRRVAGIQDMAPPLDVVVMRNGCAGG